MKLALIKLKKLRDPGSSPAILEADAEEPNEVIAEKADEAIEVRLEARELFELRPQQNTRGCLGPEFFELRPQQNTRGCLGPEFFELRPQQNTRLCLGPGIFRIRPQQNTRLCLGLGIFRIKGRSKTLEGV